MNLTQAQRKLKEIVNQQRDEKIVVWFAHRGEPRPETSGEDITLLKVIYREQDES